MFDSEIRGQLAMLMGGRAAEEVTCGQVGTVAWTICSRYIHPLPPPPPRRAPHCRPAWPQHDLQQCTPTSRRKASKHVGKRSTEHERPCTCPLRPAQVSTGAVDDIRRATELAHRSVAEFGLNGSVGPLNVGQLAAGSGEDMQLTVTGAGNMGQLVEDEVSALLHTALIVAKECVTANRALHEAMSEVGHIWHVWHMWHTRG